MFRVTNIFNFKFYIKKIKYYAQSLRWLGRILRGREGAAIKLITKRKPKEGRLRYKSRIEKPK